MNSPEIEKKILAKEHKTQESEGEAKRRLVVDNDGKHSESSYSEEQQALDIEARSGDLYALKKSKGFQSLGASQKALKAYKTISGNLSALIEEYTAFVEKDLHRAQKMLVEIKKIRAMQKMLLIKLFGELNEEEGFDKQAVEEELREFLE